MKYKCELRFLVGTGTVLTAYKVEKDGSTTQLFGQEVSALRTFHMEGENLVLTGLLRFGYAFSCEHGDLVSFEVSAPSFIRARSTKPVDEVAVKHKLFIYDGFLYMSEDIADYEANAFTKKGDYLDKEHPYRFSFRASAYIDCSERFGALGIASHRNVAYLQLYLYSFREAVQKALCPGETPASDEQFQMAARNASNILHAMYTFSEFWEHAKAEEIVELCNRLPAETAVETLTEYLSGKSYTALYDFGKPTADEKKNGGKVESKQLTLEVIKQRLNELAAAGSIEDWHPEEADAKDTLLFYVWDANEDRTVEFYPLEKNGLESLKDRIHISKNIPEEWRPDRDALAEYLWNVCDRNCFITVNELVLVWHADEDSGDEDPERVRLAESLGDEYAYYAAMDGEDELAVTWTERGIVIINCGNIYDAAKEIAEEDEQAGMPGHLASDYIMETQKSAIQMLRHLMFNTNVVITSKEYPELDGKEDDVDEAVAEYTEDAYERGCNSTLPIVFPNI